MSEQGLTIAQAARALGVSTRTVRRFIKSGKIQAVLTPGPFGEEYRIHELPAVPRDRPADTPLDKTSPQATVQTMASSGSFRTGTWRWRPS